MAITHIMHREQQAWAPLASWAAPPQACGGNIWSKRNSTSAIDNDSWEVRAFAEDASSSGQWPPRSYSCSFCQREFRTAQALGGHMNVHRRERAHANQLAQLRNAAASAVAASQAHLAASQKTATTDAGAGDFSWLQSMSKASPQPPTAEFFAPKSLSSQVSLSMSGSELMNTGSLSPPSQESISSSPTSTLHELGAKPLFQNILRETLYQQSAMTSSRGFHPYEKSPSPSPSLSPKSQVNLARFSLCFNKLMGSEQEDTLDLELRLGQSSCAV